MRKKVKKQRETDILEKRIGGKKEGARKLGDCARR